MDKNISSIDLALRCRIAEGDEKAFAAFFEYYHSKVLGVAFYFTQSLSRAEDIVQDVFLKIWTKREQIEAIEQLDAWVLTIARNFSINALHKIARTEVVGEEYADYIPSFETPVGDGLNKKDIERLVQEALQPLTEQQRRVFELSKLRGLNREEIAAELQLSPNTVKMHLVRSTKYVRAYLLAKLDYLILIYILSLF